MRRLLLACCAAGALAACHDDLFQPPPEAGTAELLLNASVDGTAVQTLVVTVSALDIPAALVFNLSARDGVAAGTLRVPPGDARRFAVQAFDAAGEVTHAGEATAGVRPGTNPPLVVVLAARTGQVPITVSIGSHGVAVSPASATLGVGESVRLVATVTRWDGAVVEAPVRWAVSNPAWARITDDGVLTVLAAREVEVAATYAGAMGTSRIQGVAAGSLDVAAGGGERPLLVVNADGSAGAGGLAPGRPLPSPVDPLGRGDR